MLEWISFLINVRTKDMHLQKMSVITHHHALIVKNEILSILYSVPICDICNCFQTHKRFKRLKFTKAMFWYYCFDNKTDDSQPIRPLSLLGGKTIWLVALFEWALTWLAKKWNSQFSLVAQMIATHDEIPLWKNCINIRAFLINWIITS